MHSSRDPLDSISTKGNLALCSEVSSQSPHRNLMAMDLRFTLIIQFSRGASLKVKLTDGVEVSLRGAKSTRDHLFTTQCTERACFSGQTVEFITETSNQARKAAKVCFSGQTAKFMTVNLGMITAQALESSIIPMVKGLKEHGETEKSMGKASTYGRQVRNTTACIWTVIRKTKANLIILPFLSMNSNRAMEASKSDCKRLSRPSNRTDAFNSQLHSK